MDTRQIIRIKGILPKDKLPREYTSNKSGQKWAIWKEIVDGKETIVLRSLPHTCYGVGKDGFEFTFVSVGDLISDRSFQSLIEFIHRAGNRLHNINTSKKLGIGIKETVRI